MISQDTLNYNRIAQAIEYLVTNFKDQPTLDDLASHVNVSPYHFQRMFSEWAGVSPKKFLQYLTIEHAKQILDRPNGRILEAAYETGLSGTGRLHDLFVRIEGMTPGEYKNGGESLTIQVQWGDSRFGRILSASTDKGLCSLTFADDPEEAFRELKSKFPNATFVETTTPQPSLDAFLNHENSVDQLKLHLKGTEFQLKVWKALLQIPMGKLSTYGAIAGEINSPNASRAVGTAIGSNPVAFIIPCHRVIQASGILGGYHWNSTRKKAIIGWESAQTYAEVS